MLDFIKFLGLGIPMLFFGGGDDDATEGAEQGIIAAGDRAYGAGQMTPAEQSQYQGSFELGQMLQAIMQYQMGMGGRPSGYMDSEGQYLRESGDLGRLVYSETLGEAQDPYKYYQPTLDEQLQLTEDYINRGAQRRGLIRAGIPIEQMGRAGVELAIKEAQARMAHRQGVQQRAAGLTEYMQSGAMNRLANLTNLYGRQQQLGQEAMGRQAGAGQAAGAYWAYPYQAQLGGVYGRQAGNQAMWGQGIGAIGQIGSALPWDQWFGGGGGTQQYNTAQQNAAANQYLQTNYPESYNYGPY